MKVRVNMPKRRYKREQLEAQYVAQRSNSPFLLPFKIVTAVPKLLAQSIGAFLRRRGHHDIGISLDEDAIWLRKR